MLFRENVKEMEKNECSRTLCRIVESMPCRCCSCFTFVAYIGHHIFVSDTAILKGGMRGITGLAFSTVLNILTSSVGDGVLSAWNTELFLMKFVPVNIFIGEPLGGETRVQIHHDQVHLLVIQQWMVAVYNASKMKSDNELEQESGIFVNLKHLEDKIVAGEWDELEAYLLGFTKIDENVYSEEMFFEIRQQKYLEALNRNEKGKVHDILMNDMLVFSSYEEDMVHKEISHLLTLNDYREHEKLRDFVSVQASRNALLITIEDLIGENPKFHEKYEFPSVDSARLITMLNQSHNMQHHLCENPRELPIIGTSSHDCERSNGTVASTSADIPSTHVANSNSNLSFGIDNVSLQGGGEEKANESSKEQRQL